MQDLLNKTLTRGVTTLGVAAVLALVAPSPYVQAASSKTLGVSQQELNLAEKGWSAKKDIIGKLFITTTMRKLAM